MGNILDSQLLEVGYFLSRCGLKKPPAQLGASTWEEAYVMFYATFGYGKTEEQFRNSLKNLRDHFDSHLENSRTGWMGKDGKPQKLSVANQKVFDQLQKLTDEKLWERIRPLAVTSYDEKLALQKNNQAKEEGAKYFSSEFSGRKFIKGRGGTEVNVCHGLVVDSLKQYVEEKNPSSLVFNTQKIDLAVEKYAKITEIYEVKTSTDTQSIYTAVGQLFMHSVGLLSVTKYAVLPLDNENSVLINCLNELGIDVIWFNIVSEKCEFKLHKSLQSNDGTMSE